MPRQRREWKIYNDDVERTFTQHQTQITQLDSSISLQASTITSLDGKVENYYSELVVADTGIRTEVATKVGASTIISTINQSAESVTIDASKINLNGFVTFTNLAAYGNHTIALGDGSNTLTIDGSTITGTNLSGWIGYKLRPSSLDIYSFTSSNDLVGRLSATTRSTQMSSTDVGVALFADQGDWITIGRANSNGYINAVLWSDPSNGNTYLAHEGGNTDVAMYSTYNTFGNPDKWSYLEGSGVSINVKDGSTNYNYFLGTTSGLQLGTNTKASTIYGKPVNIYSTDPMIIRSNEDITVQGGNGKWGMRTYNDGSALTGLMIANDANADSSKHCYIDLGYNGNIYLSGQHLYFNGTQIA